MPATLLEAHVLVDADELESHGFMQTNASGIGQRDSGKCSMESLVFKNCQYSLIKQTANSAPPCAFTDIHARIDGPAVRSPRRMLTRVGIRNYKSITLGYQIRG